MMRLAANTSQERSIGASIICEACGRTNTLPRDPSHMIIMGRPLRIKLACSHCGVTRSYPLDKIAKPYASQRKGA